MVGRLLMTTEVAERLGVEPATVRRYIREGRVPAIETAGGNYRVTESALAGFMGSGAAPRGPFILAVANQKGGVGKTTTAAALGAAWADAGKRTLLIDLDPQASLTYALGALPTADFYTVMSKYIDRGEVPSVREDLESAIVRLDGGEQLLPAHLDLASMELELVTAMRREYILTDLLEALTGQYDAILTHCPPSLGLLTVNALTAATDVLIPVTPEFLAAQGLGRLLNTVSMIQRRLNKNLHVTGVLPTMVKSNTRHHREALEQIAAVCSNSDIPLFDDLAIPDTIQAADASGHGIAPTRYGANSIVAQCYRALAKRLLPVEEIAHAS